MDIERWFARDLELINPFYFALSNERTRQWEIRRLNGRFLNKKNKQNSTIVCRIPYNCLDNRILMDLRRGLYWATKAKELIQKVDENNARLVEQSNIEDEYIARYMAKRIWHFYREPQVI